MAVVITAVVGLAACVVIAVGRDPGPGAVDVAIGYARAFGSADFDAVYRLIDPELLRGRNRPAWVDAARRRPRPALRPEVVVATGPVRISGDVAEVDLDVGAGEPVTVGLVRRNRIWTVTTFAGAPASSVSESAADVE